MPRIEYEFEAPQVTDIDDISGLYHRLDQRNLPTPEELTEVVNNNHLLVLFLTSQRRLATIYHKLPQKNDISLVQEELKLSTGMSLAIQELVNVYKAKETVKMKFLEWAYTIGTDNSDKADLAYQILSEFIDYKWFGDFNSPIAYAYIIGNQSKYLDSQLNRRELALSIDFIDTKKFEFLDLNEDEIQFSGLRYYHKDSESIFANVPLRDIPRILLTLNSQFDLRLALWALGYMNSNATSEEIYNALHPVPQPVSSWHKTHYIDVHLARIKTNLAREISEATYIDTPHIDFVSLFDLVLTKPYSYFHRETGRMMQKNGNRLQLLRLSEEGIDLNLLSPRQKEAVRLLIAQESPGVLSFTLNQISTILEVDRATITGLLRDSLKRLTQNEKYRDSSGRWLRADSVARNLLDYKDPIIALIRDNPNVLPKRRLEIVKSFLAYENKNLSFVHPRTVAEEKGMIYSDVQAHLEHAWIKLQKLLS